MAPELFADDLALAASCAAGDARALALFEERYLARVPSYLAWLRDPAPSVDELMQQLRATLLVDRPAGILAYDGRGSLHAWVRIRAVRHALLQQAARAAASPMATMSSSWAGTDRARAAPSGDCPSDESLAQHVELPRGAPGRAAIDAHLDACAACRELVAMSALGAEHAAVRTLVRGDEIGRYVVLGVAGKGAMGVVYAAYDAELDRKVAIKLLNEASPSDSVRRTRIVREAQAMARVTHPNVVPAFEVGELDGRIFLAMEYVEGVTLRSWQNAEGRTWEAVLRAYVAAGEGLLAAHRAGLVHRDFKPDNVLVGADDRPRVADFGLARVEGGAPLPTIALGPSADPSLTVAGAILGTPAFMSPEQLRGESADARSDQFSFCVALYQALHHAPPFAGTTVSELLASVSDSAVRSVPPSSPVPPPIERALRRGLAADPAARFASMAELLAALSLDPRRDPAAPSAAARRFLVGGLLLLLVATTVLANVVFGGIEPISVERLYHMGLVQAAVMFAVLVVLRGRLRWNTFHWGMTRISTVIVGQMAVLRWIGMRAGLDVRWILALDLAAYAAGLATAAWFYLPGAWPAVLLCAGSAVALVTGHMSPLWAQWVYPAATIISYTHWYRAARLGTTRATPPRLPGSGETAPTPSGQTIPRPKEDE